MVAAAREVEGGAAASKAAVVVDTGRAEEGDGGIGGGGNGDGGGGQRGGGGRGASVGGNGDGDGGGVAGGNRGGGGWQTHSVVSVTVGCGSIGILRRIGVVRFVIRFGLPSAFLKPTAVTGVPVAFWDSAPFVLVPKPVMPAWTTSPASFALWSRRRPRWSVTSTSLRRREVTASSAHREPRGIVKPPGASSPTAAPPKSAPSSAQPYSLPTRIPTPAELTAAGSSPGI